jgi:DNA mismatch repair protein MutH
MMMEQCMAALARANEVRVEHSRIKQQLKSGELDPREVLRDVPDVLRKVKVGDFLTWLPRVGRHKAKLLLRDDQGRTIAGETIPLGRLSYPTRHRLIGRLPECTYRHVARAA